MFSNIIYVYIIKYYSVIVVLSFQMDPENPSPLTTMILKFSMQSVDDWQLLDHFF